MNCNWLRAPAGAGRRRGVPAGDKGAAAAGQPHPARPHPAAREEARQRGAQGPVHAAHDAAGAVAPFALTRADGAEQPLQSGRLVNSRLLSGPGCNAG